MQPDVSTRAMRYALAVADHRSFTRAAAELHLSQQALSQHIARLEADLGLSLFERRPSGASPTPAGQAWLDAAATALTTLSNGLEAARDATRADGRTTLRLGYVTGAAGELTSILLADIEAAFPDLDLELIEAPLADTSAGLMTGAADVAILRAPLTDASLRTIELLHEPRVAALAARHPLAARVQLEPADLSGHPLLGLPGADPVAAAFWSLADVLGDQAPQVARTPETINEELQLISRGGFVSVTATSATRYFAWPGVVFRQIVGSPPSRICVAVRADESRSVCHDVVAVARATAERETVLTRAFASASPGEQLSS